MSTQPTQRLCRVRALRGPRARRRALIAAVFTFAAVSGLPPSGSAPAAVVRAQGDATDPSTTTSTTSASTTSASTTSTSLAPAGAGSSATGTAAPPDPSTPVGYVTIALDFVERYALRRTSVDFPALRAKVLARAATLATVPDSYPLITAVLREIGDRHASFSRPPDASNLLVGRYTGFGFTATFPDRIVIALADGGPAAKAGLRLRDRIERVNGKTPAGTGGTLYIPRENGREATRVVLEVTRPKVTKRLRITIDQGQPTLVSAPRAAGGASVAPGRPLADRIGYLDLQGVVTDQAGLDAWTQSVHDAIRTIDTPTRCGWVLDLRRNRGGYIYPMLAAVGPLLGEGVVAGKRDVDGVVERWSYRNGTMSVDDRVQTTVAAPYRLSRTDVPVAVLTSELTASAAEAVTIAFAGRPNTRSFGRPTMGLTTFTVMRAMPDNALISVTNAVDIDRAGNGYDGPVRPDEAVEWDWATIATAQDRALVSALSWLAAQPSCRT
jgi:carboxyl-terminal processing protease